MRYRFFVVFSCTILLAALVSVPAQAQRGHRGRGGRVFHPYYHYLAFGQWYPGPYPIFGLPGPGFFVGDHFSSVRIQVPQRDALVYVDGYAAGIVDDFDGVFQRLQLIPGHHEIVVYLLGYRTLRQNLYLNPRSTHTIKHTLVPLGPGEAGDPQPVPRAMPPLPGAPPPLPHGTEALRSGTLALRVQPGDASVFIDGELWRGPQGQDRLVIQVAEGSHRVRVEKPGFQPFDVQVDVRAGDTTSFNVSLVQ